MQDRAKRGAYKKGIERRKAILERAVSVFAEKGGDRTSLRAIAEEIGISHATILHYFPSLEALLLEVLASRERASVTALRDAGIVDLREELAAAAKQNVAAPGHMALYTRMLSTAMDRDNELSAEFFRERFARGRRVFAEAYEASPASPGEVRPDPAVLASVVMAAFDGLQAQWLLDPSVDIEAALRLLAPLIGELPADFSALRDSEDPPVDDPSGSADGGG